MHRYIWLIPLLPLAGAALNGLLGRKFRFSEKVIGGIAVGSIALSFLLSLTAVYSYAFSSHSIWPNPYVTSQDGAFKFSWIPGGAVNITQGSQERMSAAMLEESRRKLAEIPPEQRTNPQSILVAGVESPRSAVLDVEWSYQLDALSSIFM